MKKVKEQDFFVLFHVKIKIRRMITIYHIIDEKILENNENIAVSINDDKEIKNIKIKNKKVYTSEKYDTTIIEINSKIDKIYKYLELDDIIFNENINIYNKTIYILQYYNIHHNQKAAVSYGIMKNIQEYNIIHYCNTVYGSSGSPILSLEKQKIIGIHKDTNNVFNYNRGTLLKYPINEYKNMMNEKKDNENLNTINGKNNNGVIQNKSISH